jgi:hypothetical protein
VSTIEELLGRNRSYLEEIVATPVYKTENIAWGFVMLTT